MYAGLAALAARVTGSWTSGPVVWTLLAALAATLPTLASLAAAGAGATRRNGGPLGKTERCALAVLATAVPGWLGWLGALVVIGSVVTAALRLRAAHAELRAGGRAP
jgi:CDP-diacylglycerol--glycerol-3-phosphate 3-phosphatidyltransferase